MIKQIATYIMSGRRQAIMSSLLASLLPFVGATAHIILALVTLRKGQTEGLWVLLCLSILVAALGLMTDGGLAIYALLHGVFIWCIANVLRTTVAWSRTLEAAGLFAVVGVAGLHVYIGDMDSFWPRFFAHFAERYAEQTSINIEQTLLVLESISHVLLGLYVTAFMLWSLLMLLAARWVQARLYNPGALVAELVTIRLSLWGVLAFLLVLIARQMNLAVAHDAFIVIAGIFALAGLSLLHYAIRILAHKKFSVWPIVSVYVLLVVFSQQTILFLMVLGLVDALFDVRKRWLSKSISA